MQTSRNSAADATVIAVWDEEFATPMARRVVTDYIPGFIAHFIEKNRKYAKVDNHLGARGVYPDVNRKVGILEDRVWSGNESPGESTVEVIDDLIGHLFLMRDMLVQKGNPAHEHVLDGLQNCAVPGCNYVHVGSPLPTWQPRGPLHTGDLLPDNNINDSADRLSRGAHGWTPGMD